MPSIVHSYKMRIIVMELLDGVDVAYPWGWLLRWILAQFYKERKGSECDNGILKSDPPGLGYLSS
jgi:hypothetical protein